MVDNTWYGAGRTIYYCTEKACQRLSIRAKYQTHEQVYKELGICKQTLSYWAKNPDHTQTKKQLRYDTIVKCSRLFELTPKETELLANKAGLSITHFDSAKGFPSFDTQWILSSPVPERNWLSTPISQKGCWDIFSVEGTRQNLLFYPSPYPKDTASTTSSFK